MAMLERHELEAFLALAEELHFGRTAERLHVSTRPDQPDHRQTRTPDERAAVQPAPAVAWS
ncbi:hypothetical protein AB0L25_15820 [Spirillospora sp. NPDC052242]